MAHTFIPKPAQGRRFVIADIHGCKLTLVALVAQLQITKDDQLFFLGDYVNRGTDSMGVLKFIIALQEEGYAVFALRGNHEQMLIEKLQMRARLSNETRLEKEQLLQKISKTLLVVEITPAQKDWLEALPHCFVLDKFYLVHGAINTHAPEPLEDIDYMLWERTTDNAEEFLAGKQLIHGHTIHSLTQIKEAIAERHDCIPLDNGCYKGCGDSPILTDGGLLCALELDAWKLYTQKNLD